MHRGYAWLLHAGCLGALVLSCFGSVLFSDRQLDYRDGAHYYYPLYQRVQQEWAAGRLPLWEPEENGGMPLLGNPTAAVLYPGKLIYAALPYPWAAKAYVVAHLLLAAGAMWLLLRDWGASPAGRVIGALSYAFGMPVLFQYSNVVFLVGAAWLPLGVRACDRWLRAGRRWGLVELALVLALQTLGGDPETAYLLGVASGGYAWMLASRRSEGRTTWAAVMRWLLVVLVAWFGVVLGAAYGITAGMAFAHVDQAGPGTLKPNAFVSLLSARSSYGPVLGLWVLLGIRLIVARSAVPADLRRKLLGLAGAAGLAAAVIGVQLLPTLEYTSRATRSAGGAHELFPFSVPPARLLELLWPGVLGASRSADHSWLAAIEPGVVVRTWVPSLYVGAVTALLAIVGFGWREEPPWRGWLSAILLVSVLGSLGLFASPLRLARHIPAVAERVGPRDPRGTGEARPDHFLPDSFGSPYWLMAQVLPGFRAFRYPSKLLTFTSLALAGLAAFGSEGAVASRARGTRRLALILCGLGALGLAGTFLGADALLAFWKHRIGPEMAGNLGPFRPEGALRDLRWGLGQGSAVLGLAALGLAISARRPRLAAGLVVLLATADLAVANAPWVFHSEQALFDAKPEMLASIEEAERESGSTAPYRVHRMPIWEPAEWLGTTSADRVRDILTWQRKTIQPKFAIPYRMEYTISESAMELLDYRPFFAPTLRRPNAELARLFNLRDGEQVIYYPRRGFDLWNTKYFVLPSYVQNDVSRSVSMFMVASDRIEPASDAFQGPGGRERRRDWDTKEDWVLYRNPRAFPRAWVVHEVQLREPIRDAQSDEGKKLLDEILYEGDALWVDPGRVVRDPRQTAWVETDDPSASGVLGRLPGGPARPAERPALSVYEPQRVEIDVTLERPGLLVLADAYYPGWTASVDGRPATILRTNRAMRGVSLETGAHHLVFSYEPASVKLGAALSVIGLIALAGASVWASRQGPSDGDRTRGS